MLIAISKAEYDIAKENVSQDKPSTFVLSVLFAKSKSQIRRVIAQKGLSYDDYKILSVKETK